MRIHVKRMVMSKVVKLTGPRPRPKSQSWEDSRRQMTWVGGQLMADNMSGSRTDKIIMWGTTTDYRLQGTTPHLISSFSSHISSLYPGWLLRMEILVSGELRIVTPSVIITWWLRIFIFTPVTRSHSTNKLMSTLRRSRSPTGRTFSRVWIKRGRCWETRRSSTAARGFWSISTC